MAFAAISGSDTPKFPSYPPFITTLGLTSSVIDATGEKFAWSGRVWTPGGGTKSIRKVGFVFGTVTKAGGSALKVSLQDVSTAAGAPTQPDETQDQTVAIANADAGFTSNAAYETGNLSADRSVTFGEALSIVVEYDGGGRLGADAVNFANAARSIFGGSQHFPACSLKTASWASVAVIPNVWLIFSDGTYGTLMGSFPCTALSTLSYKQDTATEDEYSVDIPISWDCKTIGLWAFCGGAATTADFDFVLYDGTTAMTGGTVSHDGTWITSTGETRLVQVPFTQEIELAAGTTYHLALKPTQTTSNARLGYFDVPSASVMGLHSLGANCLINSRLDLGAWIGTVATRRPFMGLNISALDDGAGGGASGGQPANLSGGIFQ